MFLKTQNVQLTRQSGPTTTGVGVSQYARNIVGESE